MLLTLVCLGERVKQLLFQLSASLSLDYIGVCLLFYLRLECVYLCSVSQGLEFICLRLLSIAFGLCLLCALFHWVWTLWAWVSSTDFGLCLFCFPKPENVAVHGLLIELTSDWDCLVVSMREFLYKNWPFAHSLHHQSSFYWQVPGASCAEINDSCRRA